MKRLPVQLLILIPFFLLTSVTECVAQVDSMINVYGQRYPQEKIYVHFDKQAYNTGETVWFKAYLFAGILPSKVSKNFYAELLDPSGKVIQKRLLPIFESTAAGSFDLPDTLKASSLVFRAYTTWMLNFDTAFLYTKTLRLLNNTVNADVAAKSTKTSTTINFFPEGGDLVQNLESVVAFKATDIYGFPVSVNGVVKDGSGATVAEFESEHDGMGKFTLTPQSGKTYYAEWQDAKKQSYKTTLPPAKKAGVVLKAGQIESMETFVVKRSEDVPENLKTLYMIGYFNQQVVYKARLNMAESFMISGGIPLQGIPTGILQMTLFDANWHALAERICFINKEDYIFSTRVTPVVKDLSKRGKNTLVIEVPDTIKTNLSIAITDAVLTKAEPDADNIVSRLLMSGDLKGYIHNPYYYFFGNDEIIRAQRDLVMMTHGWRRYKWEDLAMGKLPEIKFPRENYLSVDAHLTGLLPSQIPGNTELNVFLEAKDSSRQLFLLTADTTGHFSEDGLIFFDTVKVFYQFNNNRHLANRAVFNFSNGTWQGRSKINPDTSWQLLTPLDTALLNRGKYFAAEAERIKPELNRQVKVLETVTVRARARSKQQEMDDNYTSGLFKGGDAVTFDLVNDPLASGALSIFQYLQGRVAGLQITTGGIGGGTSLTWRQATPTLFLNEMQVDVSTIENLSVTDIAYVKAFRPPFFGATGGGAGGAIAIYTKKGNEARNDQSTGGLEKGRIVGYAPPKEFYSPDYTQESPLHEVPDVRTTLFWAPYILTEGSSRRVTLSFYNNDVSQRLRIVLEGMDEEGRLTRVERIIED